MTTTIITKVLQVVLEIGNQIRFIIPIFRIAVSRKAVKAAGDPIRSIIQICGRTVYEIESFGKNEGVLEGVRDGSIAKLGPRRRSAKPLFPGSNPGAALNSKGRGV